ncbi:MAG: hypothetical protein J1F38_08135 [Muribaculaceae bacterium]|nr:hypothetical protein [Muribaculaceae bacterium]
MVSTLIKIKHTFPGLWKLVEKVNGSLFSLLYKNPKEITKRVIVDYENGDFKYSIVEKNDIPQLIAFRKRQKFEYLKYFDPHRFDKETLEALIENKAYSLMKITEKSSDTIVGYFFIRCFLVGKAFHGLITDQEYVNRGLGTTMWQISMKICSQMGVRMFATVSKFNIPSLKSASNATQVRKVNKLDNDFLLIECYPKKTS